MPVTSLAIPCPSAIGMRLVYVPYRLCEMSHRRWFAGVRSQWRNNCRVPRLVQPRRPVLDLCTPAMAFNAPPVTMKPIGPTATRSTQLTFPSGKTVSFGGKDADGNIVADDFKCLYPMPSGTRVDNQRKRCAPKQGCRCSGSEASASRTSITLLLAQHCLAMKLRAPISIEGKEYVGFNMHVLHRAEQV